MGGKIFFIHNCAFASERQQDRNCDFWSGDYLIKITPKPSNPCCIKFITIIIYHYWLYHWIYSPFCFMKLLRIFKLNFVASSTPCSADHPVKMCWMTHLCVYIDHMIDFGVSYLLVFTCIIGKWCFCTLVFSGTLWKLMQFT